MVLHARFVAKRLIRSPGALVQVAATIAVGVALTCAGAAIVHAVLLQPLPYKQPDRLVRLWQQTDSTRYRHIAQHDFLALREGLGTPVATYAQRTVTVALTAAGDAPLKTAFVVSTELFDVLDTPPKAGRGFVPTDEQISSVRPVIVSERLVSAAFPTLSVGQTLYLDRLPHHVVGIMPARFSFPDADSELWLCDMVVPGQTNAATWTRPAIARLDDHTRISAFVDRVNGILAAAGRPSSVQAVTLHDLIVEEVRAPILALAVGATMVLLLVVINAGWLSAARAREQLHGLTLMRALGASRWRIVLDRLTEAAMIAAVAAPAAVLLVWTVLVTATARGAAAIPRFDEVQLTPWLVAAIVGSLAVSVAATLPGIIVSAAVFRESHATRLPSSRGRIGSALMVLPAGVVLAVLVHAVLLILTFRSLLSVNVGFGNRAFVTSSVTLPPDDPALQFEPDRLRAILDEISDRGLRAGFTTVLPLSGVDMFRSVHIDGAPLESARMFAIRAISPSFFSVVGLPFLAGHGFGADAPDDGVVIDEDLALTLWGTPDALGNGLRFGMRRWTVIGVVPQISQAALLQDAPPTIYLPYTAAARINAIRTRMFFVATGTAAPQAMALNLSHAVKAQFPGARVEDMGPFSRVVRRATGARELLTGAAALFSVVAVLLVAAGLHGMLSQAALARSKELGVKIALGAPLRRVLLDVLRPLAAVVLFGSGVAAVLVAVIRMTMERTVFVPAMLPPPSGFVVAAAAATIMAAVAAAASLGPIRRMLRTDPTELLKQ
ncbi:MAG: ABC transporter permease [Acidobacteria bacterium]|nr:ABC transporter permease [Acidobacteriota bacterium]